MTSLSEASAGIFSGANDFLHTLRALAAQGITPVQVPGDVALFGQIEARAEANCTTAVQTPLAARPSVRLVVATVPDISLLGRVAGLEPDGPTHEQWID